MQFARDIMILGRQDVINQLTKLVPHMLKVCSYHLDLNDPNRGESYFFEHPEYSNGSPTERQDIERLGSTYFTLNLESIYFWAKWVPADQYGNQSIYSKGLNTLFQRGVKFNNTYHYYKNSDTEKYGYSYVDLKILIKWSFFHKNPLILRAVANHQKLVLRKVIKVVIRMLKGY